MTVSVRFPPDSVRWYRAEFITWRVIRDTTASVNRAARKIAATLISAHRASARNTPEFSRAAWKCPVNCSQKVPGDSGMAVSRICMEKTSFFPVLNRVSEAILSDLPAPEKAFGKKTAASPKGKRLRVRVSPQRNGS